MAFNGLKESPDGECYTMQDVFLRSVKLYSDKNFLGTADKEKAQYVWKSFKDIKVLAERLGSNINRLGLFTHVDEF